MVDFYERKEIAFARVKKLVAAGSGSITRGDIMFDATERSALGEKTLFRYLDSLIERGFIIEKKGILFDPKEEERKKKELNEKEAQEEADIVLKQLEVKESKKSKKKKK